MRSAPAALALALVALAIPAGLAQAQPPPPADPTPLLQTLRPSRQPVAGAAHRGAWRVARGEDGRITYLGAPRGWVFDSPGSAGRPDVSARSFLETHRALFGLDPASGIEEHRRKRDGDFEFVRFQQTHRGVPVLSAEIVVQLESDGGVAAVLSDIAGDAAELERIATALPTDWSSGQVTARVRELVAARAGGAAFEPEQPRLALFVPAVVGSPGPARRVWEVEVRSDDCRAAARLLLDARDGSVVWDLPLCHDALNRQVFDANNTTASPGTLVRSEGQGPAALAEANAAYDQLGDTWNFYWNEHGRDSWNGGGAVLSGTVRQCISGSPCPWANARWNTGTNRMEFGQGWVVDDVTAHEVTHGVTITESNLTYANTSGAINESFSDIWGEYVDLGNGTGNDAGNVRWDVGEDLAGGRIRSMSDPPALNDPDRVGHPFYIQPVANPTLANDYGGVHTNSGVCNKLCFLLTDGQTFNGQTVYGMGIPRVADLFYQVQANLLTSGAGWAELFNALQQAAVNLAWNDQDQNNLYRACLAVEIATPVGDGWVDQGLSCLIQAGLPTCDGFSGPYNTVWLAVTDRRPGSVLRIRPGTYPENLTIQKTLTLRAEGGTVVIGQ